MHYRFVSILVFCLGAVSCADREILLQLPEGNSFQSNTLVQVKLTEKLRKESPTRDLNFFNLNP